MEADYDDSHRRGPFGEYRLSYEWRSKVSWIIYTMP